MPLPSRLRRRIARPVAVHVHLPEPPAPVEAATKAPEAPARAARGPGRRLALWGVGVLMSLGLFLLAPLLVVGFVASKVASVAGPDGSKDSEHVAVVDLRGEIAANASASIVRLAKPLEAAFSGNAKAVVIRINSPGGSPVQSALLHDHIARLKARHGKPVVALGEDMLTSGAYMVAVAADRIVVNRSTLVGSIGVVSQQFGFVDAMEKLGIENRTQTAGQSKARLSPFAETNPEDQAKLGQTLTVIHRHFIDLVESGREDRLNGSPERLFSGDFWTGEEGVELGLVDELGDLHTVMASYDVSRVVVHSPRTNFLEQLSGSIGAAMGRALVSETHHRLAGPGLY